jgi:hypothetical protein
VLGRFPHDAPLLGAVALAVDAADGITITGQAPTWAAGAEVAPALVIEETA